MADNTTLNAGAGGDVIATDDIGGIKYQIVKLATGLLDTATLVSGSNPLPIGDNSGSITVDAPVGTPAFVRLSDGSAAITALPITDNAGSLTVDNGGTFAVQAAATLAAETTKVIGTVNIAATQTLATVTTVGAVTAITNALPAGTNGIGKLTANSGIDIGDVDVTSIIPGVGATNLGKAEDAVHADGDTGVMALAVRRDANTTLAGATGDYAPFQVDASGNLKVAIISGAGSGGTAIADAAAFTRGSTSATPIAGVVETSAPTLTNGNAGTISLTTGGAVRVDVTSGGVPGFSEDTAHTSGDVGVMVFGVRNDAGTALAGTTGDYIPFSMDSSGAVRVVGSSGTTQYVEDVASAGAESLCLMGAVRRDTAASSSGTDGDYSTVNTDNSGRIWVNASGVAVPITDNAGSLTVDNGGTFAVQATIASGTTSIAKAEDVASADADVGVPALAVRKATPANTSGTDGDYEFLQMSAGRLWTSATVDAALPAGNNNIGDVDVATVPTDPFGANADAASATGSISAKLRFIASTGIPVTGTVTVGSHAVTNAGTFVTQENGALLTSSQLIDDTIVADDAVFTPGTTKVNMAGYTADETSTDSVDEGDGGAARMTLDRKQIVTNAAHTQGGATAVSTVSAASTNATSLKASAGQVYSVTASNVNAAIRYLKFYNKASAPTVGTDTPVYVFPLPGNTAGAGVTHSVPVGLEFPTGIAWALTTGATVADTGAVAASEIIVSIGYK